MANIYYLQILDFLVGWFGWDICGDDAATRIAREEASKGAEPFDSEDSGEAPAPPKESAKPPPGPAPAKATQAPPKKGVAPPKEHSPEPTPTPPKPLPKPVTREPVKKPKTPHKDLEKTDVGPLDAQP